MACFTFPSLVWAYLSSIAVVLWPLIAFAVEIEAQLLRAYRLLRASVDG